METDQSRKYFAGSVTCRCVRKPNIASRAADHVERGHYAAATGHLVTNDQSGGSAHSQYGRPRCHADQRQHPEPITDSAAANCTSSTGCSHQVDKSFFTKM